MSYLCFKYTNYYVFPVNKCVGLMYTKFDNNLIDFRVWLLSSFVLAYPVSHVITLTVIYSEVTKPNPALSSYISRPFHVRCLQFMEILKL